MNKELKKKLKKAHEEITELMKDIPVEYEMFNNDYIRYKCGLK